MGKFFFVSFIFSLSCMSRIYVEDLSSIDQLQKQISEQRQIIEELKERVESLKTQLEKAILPVSKWSNHKEWLSTSQKNCPECGVNPVKSNSLLGIFEISRHLLDVHGAIIETTFQDWSSDQKNYIRGVMYKIPEKN